MKLPKNQHQQALWYLYHWEKPFSLLEIINHSRFHKFQTRLSEIEIDCCCFIAERQTVKFTNLFGNKGYYCTYKSCIPKEKLIELFEKYN